MVVHYDSDATVSFLLMRCILSEPSSRSKRHRLEESPPRNKPDVSINGSTAMRALLYLQTVSDSGSVATASGLPPGAPCFTLSHGMKTAPNTAVQLTATET